MSQTGEVATLGGGCFWCLEAVYLGVEGVNSVESGYAGGETQRPTYEQVCDRSVIFTHSDAQRDTALQAIREIGEQGIYDGQIVTQVLPLDGNYWPAEAYHQNYFAQHPNQGYCSFVVAPKVAKFRQKFAHRIKAS
jgi:peptide-methionine (S)-S-oxide reductase